MGKREGTGVEGINGRQPRREKQGQRPIPERVKEGGKEWDSKWWMGNQSKEVTARKRNKYNKLG